MLGSREGSLLSGLRMGSDSVLVNSTKELFREGYHISTLIVGPYVNLHGVRRFNDSNLTRSYR